MHSGYGSEYYRYSSPLSESHNPESSYTKNYSSNSNQKDYGVKDREVRLPDTVSKSEKVNKIGNLPEQLPTKVSLFEQFQQFDKSFCGNWNKLVSKPTTYTNENNYSSLSSSLGNNVSLGQYSSLGDNLAFNNTNSYIHKNSSDFVENEQLKNKIVFLQEKVNTLQAKVLFLEKKKKQLEQEQIQNQEKLKDFQHNFLSQISDAQKQPFEKIQQKDAKIKDLVHRITKMTENKLCQEIGQYMQNLYQKCQYNEQQKMETAHRINSLERQNQYLKDLVKSFGQREQTYKNCISNLDKEFEKIINSLNFKNRNSYEVVIKSQMVQLIELQKLNNQLTQQNTLLRQKNTQTQSLLQQVQKQLPIVQMKQRAEKNKIVTEMTIQINKRDNKIVMLQNKMMTLQDRFLSARKDIQQKDNFFKNYLVNKTTCDAVKMNVTQLWEKYLENSHDRVQSRKEMELKIQELEQRIQIYESL